MHEYFPLLFVGGVVGLFSIIFIIAYMTIRKNKEEIGFDRNMKDSDILKRLLHYAEPHIGGFIILALLMIFSVAYSVISPRLMGFIIEFLGEEFEINQLLMYIGIYALILITSLVFQYIQAIILQKIGQKILSALRQDVFTHIESLSHSQLNHMPVGKLVTRVTNDTNAI
jgi:ATP-binding cassette subfamily B protein